MTTHENIRLTGAEGRPFLLDLYRPEAEGPHPVIVFAHGFKGFKDWGHWGVIGQRLVTAGLAFVKFNFSHNGTTLEDPVNFADLDAFGRNNYSRELADLTTVFDWLTEHGPGLDLDPGRITLAGHSRGGGLAVVFARQDPRVSALITWAAVSSLSYAWERTPDLVDRWQQDGVFYIQNARTRQEMPLYFQLYEDFQTHAGAYSVERAARSLECPWLIVHGTADPSVPAAAARQLQAWGKNSQLHLIEGADHGFGGGHPFTGEELPGHSQELIRATLGFLRPLHLPA